MNTETLSEILGFSIGSFTLEKVFYILLLALSCYIICKILLKIIRNILERSPLDRSIQIFIRTGSRILLIMIRMY